MARRLWSPGSKFRSHMFLVLNVESIDGLGFRGLGSRVESLGI